MTNKLHVGVGVLTCLLTFALGSPAPTTLAQGKADAPGEDGRMHPGKDWPMVYGDLSSARYSTLTQIDRQTVTRLGAAWMTRFEDGGPTVAIPVVKDGLLFLSQGARVWALHAKTGAVAWSWQISDRVSQRAEAQYEGAPMPNVSGVTLGDGLVFVGLMDGRVVALSQRTGDFVWEQTIGEALRVRGESVTAPPTYVDGTLFVGLANGDVYLRGRVAALDAKTGKKLWQFFVVPGPGEAGHETWTRDNESWKLGGGGIWRIGVVDVDLGLVYYGTGNPDPMYGGEVRKGNNLYTASVIALEMKTGKLRWHYQVVHHDLWDADVAIPPILYDIEMGGRMRKGIAAMRADGYLFLLDRVTGRPLMPVVERPVPQDVRNLTAATQPFPVGADSLIPDCNRLYKGKTPAGFVLQCDPFTPPYVGRDDVLSPGFPTYAVRGGPMAYSPQTGYIYVQGVSSLGRARRINDDPWFRVFGVAGPALPPPISVMAAFDVRTNKIAWKKEPTRGGAAQLTTAGGLLFHGAEGGGIEALDAKTGDPLWRFDTGAGVGPAASYEIDGEQYVAMASGETVWALKLGGSQRAPATLQTIAMPSAASQAASPRARPSVEFKGAEVQTATLIEAPNRGVGTRWAVDEHMFNPLRVRVPAGMRVRFVNNGTLTHTVAAEDGSWTTGPLQAAQTGYATIGTPGTYRYVCKEHPWASGHIVVE